jgi:hypothetical protein
MMTEVYPRFALCAMLATAGLVGCDALVGGSCRDGFVAQDGVCVVDVTTASSGKSSGGAGGTGVGTATGGASTGGSASSVGGGMMCRPPLVQCPDGCVNLQMDVSNCGACDNFCLSEICVEGACVGQTVGHVVVIGMNYSQVSQPMRQLLGNAVFLPPGNPLRLAEWHEHAAGQAVSVVNAVLIEQATLRGRALSRTAFKQDELIDGLLNTPQDVLLVYDQTLAQAGSLASWGTVMQPALSKFTSSGGTVVVLATNEGTAEMDQWLVNSELLAVNSVNSISGEQVSNDAPGHAVGLSVLSPFLAKPETVSFDVTVDPQAPASTILSRAMDGAPVVTHQIRLSEPEAG